MAEVELEVGEEVVGEDNLKDKPRGFCKCLYSPHTHTSFSFLSSPSEISPQLRRPFQCIYLFCLFDISYLYHYNYLVTPKTHTSIIANQVCTIRNIYFSTSLFAYFTIFAHLYRNIFFSSLTSVSSLHKT